MPRYIVVCRGSLHLSKDNIAPSGTTVDMSEEHAASLPPGTVELVVEKKAEKKAEEKKP